MADSGNVVTRYGDKIFLVVAVALLVIASISYFDAKTVPPEQEELMKSAAKARLAVEKSWGRRKTKTPGSYSPTEYSIKDTDPFKPVAKNASFFADASFVKPEKKLAFGKLNVPRLRAREGHGGDEIALSIRMKYTSPNPAVRHPDRLIVSFEIQRAASTDGKEPSTSDFEKDPFNTTIRASKSKRFPGARKGERLKTGTTYYYRARAVATYALGEGDPAKKLHKSAWSPIVSREIKDVFRLVFVGSGGFKQKIKIKITNRVKGKLMTMLWEGQLGERVGSNNAAIKKAGLSTDFIVTDVVRIEFTMKYTDRVARVTGMKISSYARTLRQERDVAKNANVVRYSFDNKTVPVRKSVGDVGGEDRGDVVGDAFKAFRRMHKIINVQEKGFESEEGLLDDQERGVLMKALREAAKTFKVKIMVDLTTRRLGKVVRNADCPVKHQKKPMTPVLLSNSPEGQDWVAYYCPAGNEYYVHVISKDDAFFTGPHTLKRKPKSNSDLKKMLNALVNADIVSNRRRMGAGAPVLRNDRVQVPKEQTTKRSLHGGNEIFFAIVTRRDKKGKPTILELPKGK